MTSDYDDLPPEGAEPDDESAGGAFGRIFGSAVWLVPILAAAGLIGYGLITLMQHR